MPMIASTTWLKVVARTIFYLIWNKNLIFRINFKKQSKIKNSHLMSTSDAKQTGITQLIHWIIEKQTTQLLVISQSKYSPPPPLSGKIRGKCTKLNRTQNAKKESLSKYKIQPVHRLKKLSWCIYYTHIHTHKHARMHAPLVSF